MLLEQEPRPVVVAVVARLGEVDVDRAIEAGALLLADLVRVGVLDALGDPKRGFEVALLGRHHEIERRDGRAHLAAVLIGPALAEHAGSCSGTR